ncbi:MAG: ester cyclase [Herpetosiphonaceae bacterium]|nr:ester cyclase [Herpetosiphonaceae bacterium]
MSTETNLAIVHRYVEEGLNAGNMAVIDELCAVSCVNHDPTQPSVHDRGALKQFWLALRAAFPDQRTTIQDLVAEEDRVVTRFTWRGTHTGDFYGISATGRQVTFDGIDIVRLADGEIQEIWWGYDMLGVLQQLGVDLRLPG